MRLDKYLKVSRLVKRRTVANELCDAGHISANGRTAKASYDVKVGDLLEIQVGSNLTRVKILSTPEFTTKEGASELYEILT